MGSINYRAIHAKSLWRKVNTHQSLESAINGKDGATGLFARKARINYATHGDPLYVVAWETGATSGFVVKGDATAPSGIRKASVPIATIQLFEDRGQASPSELERLF
jgi:5-methylcytosine-specific restriction protein A